MIWLRAFVLAVMGSLAHPAMADVTAQYRFGLPDDDKALSCTIEVNAKGDARIQAPYANSYTLLKEGVFYSVIRTADGLMTVPDEAINAWGRRYYPERYATLDATDKWIAVGPTEIEGRKGVAWQYVLTVPLKGVPRNPELVLADDTRLAPLGRVFRLAQQRARNALSYCFYIPPFYRLTGQLEKQGPLKIDGLWLVRTSFDPVDPSRFDAPTKPLTTREWLELSRPFPAAPALEQE